MSNDQNDPVLAAKDAEFKALRDRTVQAGHQRLVDILERGKAVDRRMAERKAAGK